MLGVLAWIVGAIEAWEKLPAGFRTVVDVVVTAGVAFAAGWIARAVHGPLI